MLFKSDLWDRRVSSAGKYRLAENSALEVLFNLTLLLRDFCTLGHFRSGKFGHRLGSMMILCPLARQILSPVVMDIPSGNDAASSHWTRSSLYIWQITGPIFCLDHHWWGLIFGLINASAER